VIRIKKVKFITSYSQAEQIKNERFDEITFLGRSNVGKSSLINNLCNQKIAMTSSTPGKTQLINYFLVNDKFYLVDLPGYGYAKTAKKVQNRWPQLIESYLQTSPKLKVIFMLMDIRRTPMEHDKTIITWLKTLKDVEVIFVLTKADKLSKSARNQQRLKIALDLFIDQKDFIFYSSTKNIGKVELLKSLEESLQESNE